MPDGPLHSPQHFMYCLAANIGHQVGTHADDVRKLIGENPLNIVGPRHQGLVQLIRTFLLNPFPFLPKGPFFHGLSVLGCGHGQKFKPKSNKKRQSKVD